MTKLIIGWQEWAELPALNIPAIKVKIDTGAKTSSIHAENIEYFSKNNKKYVRFQVFPIAKDKTIFSNCEAELIEKKNVTSSSGTKEKRPVISTKIKLGSHTWNINLNLTKRDYMNLHMLVGREALSGEALVDSGEKFVHGDKSKAQINKLYN